MQASSDAEQSIGTGWRPVRYAGRAWRRLVTKGPIDTALYSLGVIRRAVLRPHAPAHRDAAAEIARAMPDADGSRSGAPDASSEAASSALLEAASSDIDHYSQLSLGAVRKLAKPEHLTLLREDPDLRAAVEADDLPLPPTDLREGYHGDYHFEHWLTGRRDARHVVAAARDLPSVPTILEFGGATGRVIRHMPRLLGPCRCMIADAKEANVVWTNVHLAPTVIAFQTRYQPPFPIPDRSVDLAMAFSVFTHIYEYETAWLLELKRVLKPQGLLYATIHDQATWDAMEMKEAGFHPWLTSTVEYQQMKLAHPTLTGRIQFTSSRSDVRHCNVFHSHDYIRSFWSHFFEVEAIHPLRHDYQAGVIMRAR